MLPKIKHTKSVRVAGREYLYFVTKRHNAKGKPILVRLPPRDDPNFWQSYGGHMKAFNNAVEGELSVPDFTRAFRHSAKFKGFSATTQRIYGIYLDVFMTELEPALAHEVERRDILHVAATLKPGAANLFVKAVTALYKWGRYWEKLKTDPCREIEQNETGEHEPWSEEALDAGLTSDDDLVRLAVHLLYYTGQRIGDVCRMAWPHIADDRIRVRQAKTSKELRIRLHDELALELARWPRSLSTFLTLRGKPITEAALRGRIQRYMAVYGFKVVPHGLRKNAVNSLLEAECSTAEVSAITGQSLQMVEHYAKGRNQVVLGDSATVKFGAWTKRVSAKKRKMS